MEIKEAPVTSEDDDEVSQSTNDEPEEPEAKVKEEEIDVEHQQQQQQHEERQQQQQQQQPPPEENKPLNILCKAALTVEQRQTKSAPNSPRIGFNKKSNRSKSVDESGARVKYKSEESENQAKLFLRRKSCSWGSGLASPEDGRGFRGVDPPPDGMDDWEKKVRTNLAEIQRKYKKKYKELYELESKKHHHHKKRKKSVSSSTETESSSGSTSSSPEKNPAATDARPDEAKKAKLDHDLFGILKRQTSKSNKKIIKREENVQSVNPAVMNNSCTTTTTKTTATSSSSSTKKRKKSTCREQWLCEPTTTSTSATTATTPTTAAAMTQHQDSTSTIVDLPILKLKKKKQQQQNSSSTSFEVSKAENNPDLLRDEVDNHTMSTTSSTTTITTTTTTSSTSQSHGNECFIRVKISVQRYLHLFIADFSLQLSAGDLNRLDKSDLQILCKVDGYFHQGKISPICAPDVYGVILVHERGHKPHIHSR